MFSKGLLRRYGREHFSREDGVALVEFALVLPFLLVVIFGMVDLGKAVSYWNDETHLANQAARYAAVNSCNACSGTINAYIPNQAESTQLQTALQQAGNLKFEFADSMGRFPGDTGYNLTGTTKNHCVGSPVRVTLKMNYNLMSFVSSNIHLATVPIRAESTMRLEKDWKGDGSDKYTATGYSTSGGVVDSC